MKNGWHKVYGYDVYVEDGKILRGVDTDANGSQIPVYPFRACRDGGYTATGAITVNAFRSGFSRGTIIMR